MAKIMLVEDDNNLREIYEARLLAEGYEIVSAEDGEQALAMAVKEKPDLIISDIMMPKISGFDMLDILRSTPETKNTKVIMMTALSQAEDKARADKLGADRYLVKSQVTLEDVAKVAREVLQDEDTVPAAAGIPPTPSAPVSSPLPVASVPTPVATPPEPVATPPAPAPEPTPAPEPPAPPPAPAPAPAPDPIPPAEPPTTTPPAPDPKVNPAALSEPAKDEEAVLKEKIEKFVGSTPDTLPAPEQNTDPTSAAADDAAKLANTVNTLLDKRDRKVVEQPGHEDMSAKAGNQISGKKTIHPLTDHPDQGPNLNELLAKEAGKEGVAAPPATSVVSPGGGTVTPPTPQDTPNPSGAGNVVQPGGSSSDPNSIAL